MIIFWYIFIIFIISIVFFLVHENLSEQMKSILLVSLLLGIIFEIPKWILLIILVFYVFALLEIKLIERS